MRNFNEREKEIIRKIVENSSKLFTIDFFNTSYFTSESKRALYIDFNKKEIVLFVDYLFYDNDEEIFKETRMFMEYIALFDYLERNNLIYFYKDSSFRGSVTNLIVKENCSLGHIDNGKAIINSNNDYKINGTIYNENNKPILCSFVFTGNFAEKVIDWFNSGLYITEELIQFVQKGFKSRDDLKFDIEQQNTKDNLELAKNSLNQTISSGKTANESLIQTNKSLKVARKSFWLALGIGLASLFLGLF